MTGSSSKYVFKITTAALWQEAQTTGVLPRSPIDVQDGYMHFSTAAQSLETLKLHFAGQSNLQLLRIPTAPLGDALKWEPSRGGDLFPHLYAELALASIEADISVSVSSEGVCEIPSGFLC